MVTTIQQSPLLTNNNNIELTIANTNIAGSLNMDWLTTIKSLDVSHNPTLTHLSLAGLVSADTNFNITFSWNANLIDVRMNAFKHANAVVYAHNPSLHDLAHVDPTCYVNLLYVEDCAFTNLNEWDECYIQSLILVDLPQFEQFNAFIDLPPDMTNLVMHNLPKASFDLDGHSTNSLLAGIKTLVNLSIRNCTSTTTFFKCFYELTTITGTFTFVDNGFHGVDPKSFEKLTYANDLYWDSPNTPICISMSDKLYNIRNNQGDIVTSTTLWSC